MKNLIVAFISAILFIQLISCKNNPVEPPEQVVKAKEIEPGRRDYVWDETVLEIPAGETALFGGIWGSSPVMMFGL